MKLKLIILSLLLITTTVYSQEEEPMQLHLLGRATKTEIKLRWAPNSSAAWQYANKYGYVVERKLITSKNKIVKQRTTTKLTPMPLMPFPEADWEAVATKKDGTIDNFAAVAFQALYGETFEISETYSSNIIQAIDKVQENESRYSFAVLAADQSAKVAKALALSYSDNSVQAEEKYLYKVYVDIPLEVGQIDTAYIYIGLSDYEELPCPFDLKAEFTNRIVSLSWNRQLFDHLYTSYSIERSEDNVNFNALNDLPYINTAPAHKQMPELMYKLDSLPQNNKTYYYRVRGRTPFGEFGPYSEVISGEGFAALEYKPMITENEIIDNKEIIIKWRFPENYSSNISGFRVFRSQATNQKYTLLSAEIENNIRNFHDKSPNTTNYYVIEAFDELGQTAKSFPVLVQLIDSFPPAKPAKPVALIDTLGNVTLSWKANSEEDVLGYKVFRSNFKSAEFSQVTNKLAEKPIYNEKIGLKNLSKEIYYKISVLDRNFNESEFSDVTLVIKPDIVPPVPPRIFKINAKKNGILLEWMTSPSADVKELRLNRSPNDVPGWTFIKSWSVKDTIQEYLDMDLQKGETYRYCMQSVDSAGNISEISNIMKSKAIDYGIRSKISDIKIKADRYNKEILLSWKYEAKGISHYLIYRNKTDEPLRFVERISSKETKWNDKSVQINTVYNYRIKAVFTDGSQTAFSDLITLKY